VASPPTTRIARPGPGEGLAPHEALGQPELGADGADLVLEQRPQRLDELEVQVVGQPADVVVGLDRRRARAAARLDDVGVQRPLDEELRALLALGELERLLLEDPDELRADDLALGLGLRDPAQLVEEAVLGVHRDERDLEVVAERAHDLLALVLAHHPVVDEDARELVADRAVDEQRRHGGVHAAREAADDLLSPTCARMRSSCSSTMDAALHVRSQPQTSPRKVLRTSWPNGRVDDLGVVLDAVDPALDRLERRHGRRGGGRERGEARRRREDRVAVRHPAGLLQREPGEQPPRIADAELGAPVLPDVGGLHPAPELPGDELHAVADAEHRDPELEQLGIEPGRALGVHRRGAAGQDEPLRPAPADLVDPDVVGQQLGEHAALAHPAGDELRVLAAEVQDHDLVQAPRRGDGSRLVGHLHGGRGRRDEMVGMGRRRGAAHAGHALDLRERRVVGVLGVGRRVRRGAVAAGAHAHALRVCSDLPSVMSAGAIITSARLNSARS
jgi:hypothetical protein